MMIIAIVKLLLRNDDNSWHHQLDAKKVTILNYCHHHHQVDAEKMMMVNIHHRIGAKKWWLFLSLLNCYEENNDNYHHEIIVT